MTVGLKARNYFSLLPQMPQKYYLLQKWSKVILKQSYHHVKHAVVSMQMLPFAKNDDWVKIWNEVSHRLVTADGCSSEFTQSSPSPTSRWAPSLSSRELSSSFSRLSSHLSLTHTYTHTHSLSISHSQAHAHTHILSHPYTHIDTLLLYTHAYIYFSVLL